LTFKAIINTVGAIIKTFRALILTFTATPNAVSVIAVGFMGKAR